MDTSVLSHLPSIISDCKIDIKKLSQVENAWNYDEVDDPKKREYILQNDIHQKKLFETMKHELNRLNSFKDKWPLDYIKLEDLAEAGLFYLQTEDRVQCAFCGVIIYSWSRGDRPLREHMKKSPKCPFLLSCDVGNVPLYHEAECIETPSSSHNKQPCHSLKSVSVSYKPKHPRMADIHRRLMTYEAWPLKMLNINELAGCGLYYTGVSDVVTCFFCGGSLGNWEINDDPWVEHAKFFPDCAYLSLAKTRIEKTENLISASNNLMKEASAKNEIPYKKGLGDSFVSEIIEEAFEIFPKSLVLDVLSHYEKKTGKTVTSLHQLCEEILEYKELQKKLKSKLEEPKKISNYTESLVSENTSGAVRGTRDTFLCKICMDKEMGIVFQPCGHLVCCVTCSREFSNCPLCRRPITSKVRTYLS